MLQQDLIRKLAEKQECFYLYDEKEILSSMKRLKEHFPSVHFLYSVKCNSCHHVLETVFGQGFGADAASLCEALAARDFGVPKEAIQYSAPGKSEKDMAAALEFSVLTADSVDEVARIERLAAERGMHVEIGVRINPDFSYLNDEGAASKFGIDEQLVYESIPLWNQMKHVTITGIHVHLKSQELDVFALKSYHEKMFDLALRVQTALEHDLTFINLGSGIGIPFATTDQAVDLKLLAETTERCIQSYRDRLPKATIYMETGRYAVGKSGVYVTKVLDKKCSHGKNILILCSTLNGFVRPSFEQFALKFSNENEPPMYEPFFTCRNAFQLHALNGGAEKETVTIYGNLCTGVDIIAQDVEMPVLEPGDSVLITNAGAYAATLTPMQFSSQKEPAQLYVTTEGDIIETQLLHAK